ncbi:heavy metal-binding domain-containing protein [Cupriavidus campinensis]
MKTGLRCSLAAAALLAWGASGMASAADDLLPMPIDKALASPGAKERIDPNVKLLFGFNKLDGATQGLSYKTVKRVRRPVSKVANGPTPTDQELCESVFVQAVQDLQQQATQGGANAVVQIHSNWKDDETSSETTYVCAKGAAYIGVALKATLVKVGG